MFEGVMDFVLWILVGTMVAWVPFLLKKLFGWNVRIDPSGHGITGKMGKMTTEIPSYSQINRENIIKCYEYLEQNVSSLRRFDVELFVGNLRSARLEIGLGVEGYFPHKKLEKDYQFIDEYIAKAESLLKRI